MKGITTYSEKIPGTRGNFGWSVRFDKADGFLGISQYKPEIDRVLLSRQQVKALLLFVEGRTPMEAKKPKRTVR